MRVKKYTVLCAGAIFSLLVSVQSLQASPWAAVGDMQLRNDVEVLARHGVISGPVNTWPISWKQITRNLSRTSEMDLPPYVRLAVMRVKEKIPGKFRTSVRVQATNNPAIVRGFSTTPRNDLDADAIAEYSNSDSGTTIHIQGGYRKGNGEDYAHLDGSYLSQDIGNWSAYAGAFDRWWGPGRESTLLLSNNARPMPSIGLRRIEPKAFKTKWLSWMGPWQWDMFVARMEADREISHALIAGLRLTFEPIRNFEVGLSRTLQLCGEGRPCGLETWAKSLIGGADLDNTTGIKQEPGNQLASIDVSYTMQVDNSIFLKIYGEGAAEDELEKFFVPFKYSGLAGATLYGSHGAKGAQWRVTMEYSDTSSHNAFLFGKQRFNLIYEHDIYKTGYRYKGRSLGHSLDNDSKLTSVVVQYQDSYGREYTAKYQNVKINVDGTGRNPLSVPNRNIDIFEASVQSDFGIGNIAVNLRHASDGLPALGHNGAFTSIGVSWTLGY